MRERVTPHAWHPADIYALIRKRGESYTSIARHYGIDRSAASNAPFRPCYAGEQAIADFLGIPAHIIWPNRYDKDGIPLHPRIRKKLFNAPDGKNPRQKSQAV